MGNERKKINLTDIDENSIVASFKEGRPADGQAVLSPVYKLPGIIVVRYTIPFLVVEAVLGIILI